MMLMVFSNRILVIVAMETSVFTLRCRRISSRRTFKVSVCEHPKCTFKCSNLSVMIKIAREVVSVETVPLEQTTTYALLSFSFTEVKVLVETLHMLSVLLKATLNVRQIEKLETVNIYLRFSCGCCGRCRFRGFDYLGSS